MVRYKIKRLGKHWWIIGDEDFGPYGPYTTRSEAADDVRGIKRFEEGSTVSVDSPFWDNTQLVQ